MNDDQHDQAGIHEQLGRLAHAADVLHPVGIGEAQIAVEAVADIVAVEQIGVAAFARTALFSTRLAMVDLPEPDRPVNHSTAGFWPLSSARACLFTSSACQWTLVARLQAEIDHAGADRGVGEAVDQDEAARVAVVAIGIEGEGLRQGEKLQ